MPNYLPNYQHDIFVSYAAIDDEPLPLIKNGWVTTLIDSVRKLLGKYLGSLDAFSLWMAPQAQGNTALTPDTLERLKNSATFVLILSPAYLASKWCRLELNVFLVHVGNSEGRIFVVEHNQVSERPPELSDLLGYRFWQADQSGRPRIFAMPKPNYETEPEYHQKIDDLARDLADKLKALKKQTVAIPPRATVFLAEVTDDLLEHRHQVKRYLEQQNIQVVPDKLYFFSGENAAERLREAMKADLLQSSLFVQLVSHLNLQRRPGMSTPQLQYECAQALALPILRWGDSSVTDDANSNFLNSGQLITDSLLITDSFENFKQYIIQQLDKPRKLPIPNIPDKSLADGIGDRLLKQDIASGMPLLEKVMTPAEKRQEIKSQYPYPGLRPFERTEIDIFFGREEQTNQLLEQLGSNRFIAVVGPSGCGKSSLVRTGLLARLMAGVSWRIAEMRPGNLPFAHLAEALLDDSVFGAANQRYFTDHREGVASLQACLRRGPFGIHDLLQDIRLPANTHLLLLVDQFEEIFRYYQQGEVNETTAFVELLLKSSQVTRAPTDPVGQTEVYVVLTMRSDFISDCALFQGLPEAINHGLFLIPRLTRDQVRDAIELPAAVFEAQVELLLVNCLLNDVGNQPNKLPQLQHALMRMWQKAKLEAPDKTMTLTLSHYKQIGGLENALSLHADKAYHELDSYQQQIAELLFRSLIDRGSEHRDTRRPVKLSAVAAIAKVHWQQVAAVVEVFRKPGRSFLTPPFGQALEADTVVDVSHESLIRQWQRLRDWTDQEAESAARYRRLEDSACRWKNGQAALWISPDLENALAWRDKEQPNALWASRYGSHFELAMRFLTESETEQQRKRQEQEMARQRELRRARQQVGWAVFGLIVTIVLFGWAMTERDHAVNQKEMAQSAQQQAKRIEKKRTESLFESHLTHASLLVQGEEYAQAQQILNETYELDNEIADSRRHARNLLAWFTELMSCQPEQVYQGANVPLFNVAVSPNGKWLAAAGEKGTVVLFDVATGRLLHRLQGHQQNVYAVVFHPEGDWLISAGKDKKIIRWSMSTMEPILTSQAPHQVYALAVSPNGTRLASAGSDNNIILWEAETVQRLQIFEGDYRQHLPNSGLAFHPLGFLVSASFDTIAAPAALWDLNGKRLYTMKHDSAMMNITFSPNGQLIAGSSQDKTVRLWITLSGHLWRTLYGHKDKVIGLSFSPDGYLISSSDDQTVRIWDIEAGVTVRVLFGHTAAVTDITTFEDQLFSASPDGTVKRWLLSLPFQEAVTLPSAAISSAIAPNGQRVAIGFKDGALRLYSLPEVKLLSEQPQAHTDRIRHLAFNSDGTLLATASYDKTAKLWQVNADNSLQEQQTFNGHTDKLYTVAFSPNSQRLATSCYDGQIGLFTIGSEQQLLYHAHQGTAYSVVFDKSGTQLLSSGQDGDLKLWNLNQNQVPPFGQTLTTVNNIGWANFSPVNEQQIAFAGRGGLIYIYAKEEQLKELSGHQDTIYRVIYTPDGQQLATVSSDATVRFWDLSHDRLLLTLRLPASKNDTNLNNREPSPLFDFDFRCTEKNCQMVVPLTSGKLLVYQLGNIFN